MALASLRAGSGIKDRAISDVAGIKKHKLDPSYRFAHEDGKGRCVGHQSDGTVASETTLETNYFIAGRGTFVEKFNIGTQVSTYPLPALSTNGLDLAIGNQTSAEGAEFCFGGNHARGQLAFTAGTDACFLKTSIKVADVSGVDLWVGFRKVQAFDAAVATYTDFASVLYDGTASTAAGVVKTQTDNDDAGETTTTMTGLATADLDVLTCLIAVDKGGNVTYYFNGALNSAAVPFQFDAGDTIVPFIAYLNTVDVAGAVELTEFTCGLAEANVR
jgi:hypothetical protein